MPFFTIDYLRASPPLESPAFIIIEEHQPLSLSKLKELNAVAKLVLNNHLTCAYVPTSFPLHNDHHRNALSLIESVIFNALENISSINPTTQLTINSLQETIDLCLNVNNSLAFEQELPIIIETPIAMDTTSKSSSQPIAPHIQKRAASPLQSYSPSKKSKKEKNQFKETFEEAIKLLLQDDSFLSLEDIETDLTPIMSPTRSSYTPFENLQLCTEELFNEEPYKTSSPTSLCTITQASYPEISYTLPIIYTSEDTKCFTILEQVVTDLFGYLCHLHEGIYYVLDNSFYFSNPTDPSDTHLSKLSLHNSSLLKLLQLLYKQHSLLGLILDNDEKLNVEATHLTLIQDIEGNLREAGFSSESLKSMYHQADIPSPKKTTDLVLKKTTTPILESFSSDKDIFINNSINNSHEKAPLIATEKSDNDEIPMQKTFPHVHLLILKNYHFIISLDTKPQRFPIFLKQIARLIKYGTGYTCYQDIKELTLKISNSRIEVLKSLYMLTKKNTFLYLSSNRRFKSNTYKQIQIILNCINKEFCKETKEKLQDHKHSKILLDSYKFSLEPSLPLCHLQYIKNTTSPTTYIIPLFSIRKHITQKHSRYHLSYIIKQHKAKNTLYHTYYKSLKKFKLQLECLLKDTTTPIFYLAFSKSKKDKIEVKDKKELILILHQGTLENKLYFEKRHSFQEEIHVNNPSQALNQSIEMIKIAAKSVVKLPIITQPKILEKLLEANLKLNALETPRSKRPLKKTSRTNKHFITKTNKCFSNCLFTIKLAHFSPHHKISSYLIEYITKKNHKNKSSLIGSIRANLLKSMKHLKLLCTSDLLLIKIKYKNPLTQKSILIKEKKELYKILYQGITENMYFLSKKEPDLKLEQPDNFLNKMHCELIQSLKDKLGESISEIEAPFILEKMTTKAQKSIIPPSNQQSPSKEITINSPSKDSSTEESISKY